MGVDREVDLLEGQPVLHRQRRLGDEVRRPRADDVGAEQPARAGVRDDLDEALWLAECERSRGCGARGAPDLDVYPLLLRLFLTEPDVRNLRVGVDAVRGSVVIGNPFAVANDVLN